MNPATFRRDLNFIPQVAAPVLGAIWGLRRAIIIMTAAKNNVSIIPGITPAMNNLPTDCSVTIP
jgi:hypothetical protein